MSRLLELQRIMVRAHLSGQEFTSYCSVCGGPILGSAPADELFRAEQRSDGSWISRVTLLSESRPEILPQEQRTKHLNHEPDLVFQSVSPDGIHETAAELNHLRTSGYSFFSTGESTQGNPNQPLMIAVHVACLDIVKHVIGVRAIDPAYLPLKVNSMLRLWDVLEFRYLETVQGVRGRKARRLIGPQNYHMPLTLGGIIWRDDADDDELTSYEANPLIIPDLSSHVLSCLQAYPQDCTRNATAAHTSLAVKLRSLPTELFDHIIDSMGPIHNLPVQCTRLIEPVYWQRLLNRKFLPYLWDLDISVVHYCLSDEKWDYELLVRQLAQEGIWDYFKKNDLGKYHPGLWNRRRIWRLVEEMEVGDLKPETTYLPMSQEKRAKMRADMQNHPRRAALLVSIPPVAPSYPISSAREL